MHAETVLRTAALIHEARPDAQFLVPLVTRSTRERFDEAVTAWISPRFR